MLVCQAAASALVLHANVKIHTWIPRILEKLDDIRAKGNIVKNLRFFDNRLEVSLLAIVIQLQQSDGCCRFPVNACCLPS